MKRLKRSKTLAALPAVLVFLGLATPKAQADVTWNYVGNAFSSCVGVASSECGTGLLSECREEDPSLVPAARMMRVEAVVAKLRNLDNRIGAAWKGAGSSGVGPAVS